MRLAIGPPNRSKGKAWSLHTLSTLQEIAAKDKILIGESCSNTSKGLMTGWKAGHLCQNSLS